MTPAQSLGFLLPSPAYLFGAIVFGLVGFAAYRFGRKRGRRVTLWLGVALMVYPYVVRPTWLLYTLGFALSAALFFDRDRD